MTTERQTERQRQRVRERERDRQTTITRAPRPPRIVLRYDYNIATVEVASEVLTAASLDHKIRAQDTSFKYFCRTTNDRPWFPLQYDGSAVAREEARLFDKMATRLKHHVAPSAPGHGFNAFEWHGIKKLDNMLLNH